MRMRITRFTTSMIASLATLAVLLSGCGSPQPTDQSEPPMPEPVVMDNLPITQLSAEAQREAYSYYISDERRQRINDTVQAIGKDLLARDEIEYRALSYFDASPAPVNGYGRLVANRTGAEIIDPDAKQITLFVRFTDGKVDEQMGPVGFQIAYRGWFYTAWGEHSLTSGMDRKVVAVKDGPLSYDWSVGELGENATQQIKMFLTGNGNTGTSIPTPPQERPLAEGAPYVVWMQGTIVGSDPATKENIQSADDMIGRAFIYLHDRFNWQP